MSVCMFNGLPKDAAGSEVAFWVSPSSTPPSSACQSSTTAVLSADTPAARHFFCSPPPALAALSNQQFRHHQHLQPAQPHPHPGHMQLGVLTASDCSLQQTLLLRLNLQQHAQVRAPWGTSSITRALPVAPCSPESLPCPAARLRDAVQHPHGQQLQNDQMLQVLGRQQSEGVSRSIQSGVLAQRQQGLKRPAEYGHMDEPLTVRHQRSCAAAAVFGSCCSRQLQRHNSMDSDVTNAAAASSCGFALPLPTAATATTVTALTLPACAAIASAAASSDLPLSQAAGIVPAGYLRCRLNVLESQLLLPSSTPRGSVTGPGPFLSAPSVCKGEDFILHAARALGLMPDLSAHLALHLWRRISGMVRLVLSIRHPAAGKDDPRVIASTYRIHATSCLWLAAKLEAQRRVVAEVRVLAALAHTSARVLCDAELRLLGWLEWCPLRGYLPPPPPPPVPLEISPWPRRK